jgi:hypothetical protein
MIVNGTPILPAQRNAGAAAMTGKFIAGHVVHALRGAGVSPKDGLPMEAAKRLIGRELNMGRIRRAAVGFVRVR